MHQVTLLTILSLLALPTVARALPPAYPVTLTAGDREEGDLFGYSIDASGNWVLVGAPGDDDLGFESGAAYLFDISDPYNPSQTKIIAPDAGFRHFFGSSVAIDGDVAIVGARFDDENGNEAGSAYILDLRDRNQINPIKLTPSDPAVGQQFGFSVAISGSKAVIGARRDAQDGAETGAAYVYDIEDLDNVVERKLRPSDPKLQNLFGESVAIDGDNVLVGARTYGTGFQVGSAYLFDVSDPHQIQETKLVGFDVAGGESFGASVAIDGDFAIVGAPHNGLAGGESTTPGAAYLFNIADRHNVTQTKLTASDGDVGDTFGESVAIDGMRAVVGAPNDDDLGSFSGSAYMFAFTPTLHVGETKLLAPDGSRGDVFGVDVFIANGRVGGGAFFDDVQRGSAHLFAIPEPNGAVLCALGLLQLAITARASRLCRRDWGRC